MDVRDCISAYGVCRAHRIRALDCAFLLRDTVDLPGIVHWLRMLTRAASVGWGLALWDVFFRRKCWLLHLEQALTVWRGQCQVFNVRGMT